MLSITSNNVAKRIIMREREKNMKNRFIEKVLVAAVSIAMSGVLVISFGTSAHAANAFTGTSATSANTSGGSSSSSGSLSNTTNATTVATWVPTTAEEKAIFSLVGTTPVEAVTSGDTKVSVQNSIQGKLCYDVFKTHADGWTLARTYSILPAGATYKNPIYSTATPVKITLTIPKNLRAKGRTFEMIGVSKNGVATVYKDEDSDPNTITITTNSFYAFALCYAE